MSATTENRGLGDDALDDLLARARLAERGGRIGDAQALLAIVLAELIATNHWILEPFAWMARLETAIGEHASAARWLHIGRDIAVQAGHATATFHVDLALARAAVAAHDLAAAERQLAQIPGAVGPPPPTSGTAERVAAWIAALSLAGERATIVGLRAEAAFTVMELWCAGGRYRSALALLAATRDAVVAADPGAWLAHASLFEAELWFAAGEIDEAWKRVDAISDLRGPELVRHAIVALRIAVRGGRLADARRVASRLVVPPTDDPVLVGQAAVARIALLNELNLYEQAHAEAEAAIVAVMAVAPASPARALLDRAAAATAFRARTAVASWELPWVPEQAWRVPEQFGEAAGDPALIIARRDRDPWIPLIDAILVALEAEDLPGARTNRDRLIEVTRDVESRYIAARVQVACALVEYYDGGPTAATAQRLLAAADELGATGARLAELQAVRFAAWSAGRLGRDADHRALAARAIAITDAIASELEPGDRTAFLMNKWSGRDDLVMLRLDHVLRTAPPHGRERARMLCALFREIEQLTCWPVDDALGSDRADGLGPDDTPDQVARWIAGSRARAPSTGYVLRSPWSLWRLPRHTVVLHYHVLPDRIILFRIAWRRIDAFVIPISRANLDRQLARCLSDLQDDTDTSTIDEILAWLAQKLGVTAALAAVPHTRRLVVIAHDVIANVPFAALPVDGVALCERVAISQLDRLSRLQRRRGPRAIGRFVGLGVTRYGGTMPDLPGAGREVAAITDLIGEPRASPRLDTAATCDAFRAALRSATHVHVAAHGRFDLGDPAASSIVLHDGAITLRDLGSIRPRELRVVALPTCWSAEAATLPGRERICLPTALLDIGARSVVASLWAVGDESSADLMLETYRHMRRLGPAAALTAAQAARARRGEPRRDWAGFLCYGRD